MQPSKNDLLLTEYRCSALGFYLKFLRQARGLTQEVLVKRFAEYGSKIAAKQIWSWETGSNRPESVNKAIADKILKGNPQLSDELLLYDAKQAHRISDLQLLINDDQQPEKVRQHAEQELKQISQDAQAYGKKLAHRCILLSELEDLSNTVFCISTELKARADIVFANLVMIDTESAKNLIHYGQFLIERQKNRIDNHVLSDYSLVSREID
jgi:transcriptional regulator with XRE-family HTH domain